MFFIFTLCLITHKSVKIFNIDMVWLIFICYHQKRHTVFKVFIRYMSRIRQTIFITKHINANFILLFNLLKIFFRDRKFNTFIIKIINHVLSAFVILSGCIFSGFKCLIWHQRKHLLSLFLILIRPFTEFLNSWGNLIYVLPDNGHTQHLQTQSSNQILP